MAAPVWVLSVDLQTKTAAFTSGMADAARTARQRMSEIGDSAKSMGDGVNASSMNVRAGLGLIDNTIRGNHAAAMADLIREFQNTRAVMMLLPFAAVIGGFGAVAGIAVEVAAKIREHREEQEQLRLEMTRFDTAVQTGFNSLDAKLIQAEKRTDELRNDHLGALKHELQLIDLQTFSELVKSLADLDKAADEVFKHLEGHWYTLGIGSEGAKHALDTFKTGYDGLVAQGDTKGAAGLLTGTLDQAQKVLALQKQARDNNRVGSIDSDADMAKDLAHAQAVNALKQYGVGYTEKEVAAQQTLVSTLQAQANAQQKIADIANQDKGNATKATGNEAAGRASERAKQEAATNQAIAEAQLQGDKAVAMGRLELARASVEERLRVELDFADRDFKIKQQGLSAEIAAVNKSSADYANQVAALQGKERELTAQHLAQRAELTSKATVEQYQRDIQNFEAGERALVAATQEGSAERLAAIDKAITDAQAKSLQDTEFYRSLGQQRVEAQRQMQAEMSKVAAEGAKVDAEHVEKMGQLALQADIEQQALRDSARRMTDAQRIDEELQTAEREYQVKMQALQQQADGLDKGARDYEVKLRAMQNREIELTREHEQQKTAIIDSATLARNQRILSAETQFQDALARGLTETIMRHQSFAQMMGQLGDQVVAGMLQNAIKSVLMNDFTKESDAAAAARKAYLAGMQLPFPANIVAAPLLAAGAFTAVMAFAGGTDYVPGVGRGDVTPAMLTPGEGVVPGGVMDGLRTMARNDGFKAKGDTHIHPTFAPTIQAIDTDGVRGMLREHADEFYTHVTSAVRKMNA